MTDDRAGSAPATATMAPMVLPPPSSPGRLRLRIATSSGTVNVTAEDRADVVVERGGDLLAGADGVVEVRPTRASSSIDVLCPSGTDLMIGTSSGGVRLHGRFGSVSVTSSSGSIRAEDVAEADLRTQSGAVELGDCGEGCRISTKSGKVTVDGTGAAEIATVSGTIRVGHVSGAAQATTVSGGVEISTDAGGPVRARTVSGSISIRLPRGIRPALRISGPHQVRSECEQGDDVVVEISTMSGTVEIAQLMPLATTEAVVVSGVIVFTDIVGFTEYTAIQGDDAALALLATQERLVVATLPIDARIVKELGDGLLLWFPESVSALRTGLALQSSFEEEATASGLPLWVRMGMHSGHALQRGDDLVGHDVNVAARIVDVAGPGELLVSEATRVEADGKVPKVCFDKLGPVVMKGIPEPVRLYRATCA